MANNKVKLADGTTLIDITDTTASTQDVAQGKYFYSADGVKREGTLVRIPSGGSQYMVLLKSSNTDYDMAWEDIGVFLTDDNSLAVKCVLS